MKIAIIGAGIVGQATGMGLGKYGHDIVFHDADEQVLNKLAKQGYETTKNLVDISDFDIHMICINTPLLHNKYDLHYLESAVTELATVLGKRNKYQLIVVRGTVLPFTIRETIIPLLQLRCSMKLGEDYGLCYNPEFLRQDYSLEDFLHSPVVVIGEFDRHSGERLAELYRPFKAPKLRTTIENAEAIKCFSNAYNSMKVSFFNLIFLLAEKSGLDHNEIEQGLIKASLGIRLPSYYTSGGRPFGGSCLPKDLRALVAFIKNQGIDPELLEAVESINEVMKENRCLPARP